MGRMGLIGPMGGITTHHSPLTTHHFGSSLLPTMVRLTPTWTVTGTPFTSTTVLPFRYHPSDPVENSRGSARSLASLIMTVTGLAPSWNCWRVIGHVVLAIVSLRERMRHAGES